MQPIPNIRPISDFRNHQEELLQETNEAPVTLAIRGRPRVVVVDVDEWNTIAKQMQDLRQIVKSLNEALKEERKGRKHYSLDEVVAMAEQKKAVAA